MALFLEESLKLLKNLRGAIDRLNGEELRRAAHALKGAVANFCADPAKSAASRLEEMGKNGDFNLAEATYVLLQSENKRLREDLLVSHAKTTGLRDNKEKEMGHENRSDRSSDSKTCRRSNALPASLPSMTPC